MLTARIIPCLDVKGDRVVKGVRFSGLRDAGDPVERATAYERQGADELVVLDVSATAEGRNARVNTVAAIREKLSIPLIVGGGVSCVADAADLLCAGADKVSLNTAAVRRPDLLSELSSRFGCQCTVLALDAATNPGGGWEVVARSGSERTGLDVATWVAEAVARGAGEILLTSWDRDGTRSGYDEKLIKAVRCIVSVPIIASGGADGTDHMLGALQAGADAVLAASIFHGGDIEVNTVKAQLARRGIEIRR